MQTEQQSEVSAIIVTYNPDVTGLGKLLTAIGPQVSHVIIVDNGSKTNVGQWLAEQNVKTEFVALGSNYGIAKAQNVGIDRAGENGSDFILLLDQDSVPAPNMATTLLAAARAQIARGIKLACVGPRYEDSRQNNPPPFIKIEGFRLQRQTCASADSVVDVDYLIASGSLIPMTTIEDVGGMKEELFIDYVDIEWGLRAQHKGYRSFGVCAAEMQHDLGDKPVKFRGRYIPVHSPLRHYYHFRNAVWLYRQSWPRANWKVVDAIRLVRKFVFYSFFTTPRLEHARMMTTGIFHGLLGRMGKKSDND
ncbi:glycosyltransferase family 2 protein [Phyllobacterium myrsinacearum]|uniref:Rhamnosyltransferase n=1 Tax=Phyllobacterium myrsinacearum TaxID=28101 RepID=A0A839EQU1_9HYPH|nr:glycosyltransferase family 2 protein [Phyllobacterium myrsinacearum]MBA8878827.1 rhamnosyltransferase [Phyllobacterium myrsinacearum]